MQPDKIGRYRIVEELGRGGFATVFLGEDRGLNDLVAIKILADNHAIDPSSVARFVAEARVMRNLRAPGVVTVHDVGEHEGRPYFVMEYCERGTISERLGRLGRRLTVEEGIGLAKAISRAMAGMHGASPPVVHRDIKPDNLLIRHSPNVAQPAVGELLGTDEELIVGDFGLAKVVDINSTKLSLIAYTRGFAPPEQIRGDGAIQPNADVFSASAVVAAAMSGELPEQVFASGDRAFSDEALTSTGPLRRELERGLTFERHQRHADVHAWSQALSASGEGPSADFSTEPTRPAYSPPPVGSASNIQAPQAPQPPRLPSPGTAERSTAQPVAGRTVAAPPIGTERMLAGQPASAEPTFPVDSASDGRTTSKRSKAVVWLVGLAVLAIAGAGIGLVALRGASAPTITGPSGGLVGDELAFAVLDAEVEEWTVGNSTSTEPVLKLMPTTLGDVTVQVLTEAGEADITVEIDEATTELRIVGPGHIPMGLVTTLSAQGSNDQPLTWTVDGQSFELPTLEVQPSQPGILEVTLTAADGQRVTRSFVIAPSN